MTDNMSFKELDKLCMWTKYFGSSMRCWRNIMFRTIVTSQLCGDICFMDLYPLTSFSFVIRIRLLELTCFYCFSRWRTLRTVNISLHHDTPGCFSFFVLGFNNAIYKEGNNIFLGFKNSPYRSNGFPWKTCRGNQW